ncbi:Dpy-30 motif protein [Ophiocordyceps sinensis CO18]|uniref:Dpy-30 motif protein n=1 Tax=Ophiocordyceps sinensis (strain Co18 / CGMCC 3.14243) TaxID=911162 RepID=T5AKQ6_OPHSC|nr:Dpy-30 motif protein [Ophiocordyceps sinensis CO18]
MADDVFKADTMLKAPQIPAANDAATGTNMMQQTQPAGLPGTPHKDVVMSDAPIEQAAVQFCLLLPALRALLLSRRLLEIPLKPRKQSPAPARTATPAQGSRAASAYPDANLTMPSEPVPHGDPTRRYLNTKVTGVLLEGMKQLAKDQ